MSDDELSNETYDLIIKHFTKERIKERYEWLYDMLYVYVESEKLQDSVYISEKILNHVIIDYFVDIYRLKDFQGIEKVHDSKIYAYLSFWLLRHKVIQLTDKENEQLVFVNEAFVQELLRSYLFRKPDNISISDVSKESIDNFLETLVYYFKYRDYSAKSIEMIILAFQAGRGYQYSADYKK